MSKVGCVILNYKKYNETINCVESLLKQAEVDMEIVIVDNGSENESAEILRERFGQYSNCHILESGENLGFAKGNNLGISYLRKQGVEYIWVTNSDTIFTDELITRDALEAYKEGVGLINVTSYLMSGKENYFIKYKKKYLVLRMIKEFMIAYIDAYVHKSKNKKISSGGERTLSEEKVKEMNETVKRGYLIHTEEYFVTGSVFLLTKDYFKNYGGLFPETFFYCEETATIMFLHKAGLKTEMVNTGIVLHKHRASTRKNVNNYGLESRRKIVKLFFMNQKKIRNKYFS